MAQWFFSVADTFDFDRGVVSVALYYVDRIILANQETNTFTTNEQLQLTAVTCLYIAMKLHGEIEPHQKRGAKYERKKLTIAAFVVLSKRQFDVCSIEAMELQLLSMLKWELNPPDARSFVACMLELMPERQTYLQEWRCIFDVARYIAELSFGESDLLFQVTPSVVACSSLRCAINSLGRSSKSLPPVHVLQALSNKIHEATSLRLDMDVVTETAVRLAHLCPSMFVKKEEDEEEPVHKRKKLCSGTSSTSCEPPAFAAVSIDEVVDISKEDQRKTSPVCVGSFQDNCSFLVKAGRHQSHRR